MVQYLRNEASVSKHVITEFLDIIKPMRKRLDDVVNLLAEFTAEQAGRLRQWSAQQDPSTERHTAQPQSLYLQQTQDIIMIIFMITSICRF